MCWYSAVQETWNARCHSWSRGGIETAFERYRDVTESGIFNETVSTGEERKERGASAAKES